MIGDKDENWILATASRCGSSHLRTALTQEAKKRPQNPVADYIPPWQGGKKEDVQEYDTRIFLARDPVERWNSLYWYFVSVREKPPLRSYLDSFPHFMEGILSREWSHYDCTPLTDHLQEFDPHHVLMLPYFDDLCDLIDAPYFWRTYYHQRASTHDNPKKNTVSETLDQFGPLGDDAQALIEREEQMLTQYGAYDHTSHTAHD